MQAAGEPFVESGESSEAATAETAIDRTSAWFGEEAQHRRRSAAAAAPGVRAANTRGPGWVAALWQWPALACVALAALLLAAFAAPSFGPANACRTEPVVLGIGADLDARMTVSHNGACAIWTKAENISIDDVTIATAPRHGAVALRGRTGVTYRPAAQFTGEDSFAFRLHQRADGRDSSSLVRVRVIVQ
jgi:hypothetical protein